MTNSYKRLTVIPERTPNYYRTPDQANEVSIPTQRYLINGLDNHIFSYLYIESSSVCASELQP